MPIRDFDETVRLFIERSQQYKSAEKSWEHCYKAFLNVRHHFSSPQLDEQTRLSLCLHLACYLASWGMYRNSLIRQFDYTIHEETINILFEPQYNKLWGTSVNNADSLLIGELAVRIGETYHNAKQKRKDTIPAPTTTLITKILMGTMACIPAYDKYFAIGIGKYIKNKQINGITPICKAINFEPTNRIDKQKIANSIALLKDIWAETNTQYTTYPEMKLIDMYFWEKGFKNPKK